jgi:uncharacterized protein (DUF2141 family)
LSPVLYFHPRVDVNCWTGSRRAHHCDDRWSPQRQRQRLRRSLRASPNKFLHGNECDAFKKVRASAGPITVAFDNLPPGTYAVGAYHDENGNGHLDTNLLGLPIEGYALSNGVRAILAPPRFTDAAFTVGGGDKPIALHIRY